MATVEFIPLRTFHHADGVSTVQYVYTSPCSGVCRRLVRACPNGAKWSAYVLTGHHSPTVTYWRYQRQAIAYLERRLRTRHALASRQDAA